MKLKERGLRRERDEVFYTKTIDSGTAVED